MPHVSHRTLVAVTRSLLLGVPAPAPPPGACLAPGLTGHPSEYLFSVSSTSGLPSPLPAHLLTCFVLISLDNSLRSDAVHAHGRRCHLQANDQHVRLPERSQFSILSTKRRDDDEPSVIHFCVELHADASPKKTRGHRASTFQRCLKPEMNHCLFSLHGIGEHMLKILTCA